MSVRNKKFVLNFQYGFWGLFIFVTLLVIITFILIGVEFFGPMPTFEELENPKSNLASEVISEDNVLLGTYYIQNRTFVDYEDISPNVYNALIATEDIRFYRHCGIDFRGLGRVAVKTLFLGNRRAGGGSTITQQLAKNLFPRDTAHNSSRVARATKLVIIKFKEWITAVKLERNYTKNEILAMYLNIVEYGNNAFGIKSAAKTFFNTTPDLLTVEQAALLVGVVNAPTRYSPVRNPERALQRRNLVLANMAKHRFLTRHQYDSIVNIGINLNFKEQDHNQGLGTYYREMIRNMMTARKPHPDNYYTHEQYVDDSLQWEQNPLFGWCNKNSKPDGTPYNIYRDGLKIYGTLNSKMQAYAEEVLQQHLKEELQPALDNEIRARRTLFSPDLSRSQIDDIMYRAMRQTERYRLLRRAGKTKDEIYANFNKPTKMRVFTWNGDRDTIMSPMDSIRHYKKFLRASFMAVNPHNGHIKAYVGGPNFKYFKYDMVKQGKRQVGSTIKPFIYTLAMQEGYSPCYQLPNVPQTFIVGDTTWSPKNSGSSKYDGQMVTLKWGLANSSNNISAWVMKQFTPEAAAAMVNQLGIKSKIPPVVSLFLGTIDFSLFEMVGAYTTYANKGVHVEPIFVSRIEDKNGNVLSTFNTTKTEAISEETAYLMVNLLESVVNHGTGARVRYRFHLDGAIGGKTGTSQNHSDGWFMAVTPNLVAGVWSGCEDRAVHFQTIALGQGANMSLPIFAKFLQKVYANPSLNINPKQYFEVPLSQKFVDLNCDSYLDKETTDGIELY